jgi:hypothetical protein
MNKLRHYINYPFALLVTIPYIYFEVVLAKAWAHAFPSYTDPLSINANFVIGQNQTYIWYYLLSVFILGLIFISIDSIFSLKKNEKIFALKNAPHRLTVLSSTAIVVSTLLCLISLSIPSDIFYIPNGNYSYSIGMLVAGIITLAILITFLIGISYLLTGIVTFIIGKVKKNNTAIDDGKFVKKMIIRGVVLLGICILTFAVLYYILTLQRVEPVGSTLPTF